MFFLSPTHLDSDQPLMSVWGFVWGIYSMLIFTDAWLHIKLTGEQQNEWGKKYYINSIKEKDDL